MIIAWRSFREPWECLAGMGVHLWNAVSSQAIIPPPVLAGDQMLVLMASELPRGARIKPMVSAKAMQRASKRT